MIEPRTIPVAAQIAPDARSAQFITWDSRQVGPQTAFAALSGEKTHGNAFVMQALEQGAPFVLTDLDVPRAVRVADATSALRAWGRAARTQANRPVIGITGSVGKTTAKAYVGAALQGRFMPVFNTLNAIACFLLVEAGNPVERTPLVIELGIDRVGEMDELMQLVSPDVGVVTSVGEAHLEAFGSREVIAREKGGVLRAPHALVGLQASSWYPGVPTYGFEGASYAGERLRLSPEGAHFTFQGTPVELPGASRPQAEAAVLGLALASRFGIDIGAAARRLREAEVPAGRFRIHRGILTVIDDTYNASPLSVKAALDALHQFPGRRISVLGRMLELGPDERRLHAEVGDYARQRADLTFGVGAFAGELGDRAYGTSHELEQALLREVRSGDVVLVKASRGISFSPQERARQGVGLESVVHTLLDAHKDDRAPS
ncbi:UDP-N-acetylmuramoyl-tripeptide--D-alanyl-D-alanine ligase [Deinococcus peraridilitoris]|uniref:UDP-N-acetylmuramoyl-tripeptide--D-alanyl-D- alanine ligase n=1 Tax=Deinococcus peraridilitoris TaxID=432329 RepID=UPI00059DE28B|nr:UDP-N-acetylmuramoyl-tripeptide--D-alanyl-D-alanine ligase [Deinococcus peraridilitoris]